MFDEDAFYNELTTTWLGHDFIYFEQLESTNSFLREATSDEVGHGTICLTDHQTAGRGRYDREWVADSSANLTFTLAFKPFRAEGLHVLTLACALAITETVDQWLEVETNIKWPNDVIYEGRKMGGILTESVFSGNQIDRVLVGIGLNVNQERFPSSIDEKATSMCRIAEAKSFDREPLLAGILQRIEHFYGQWKRFDVNLLKAVNQRIIGYGSWVSLYVGDQLFDGKCKFLGINEEGALVVLTSNDEIKTFSYEQVHIATD